MNHLFEKLSKLPGNWCDKDRFRIGSSAKSLAQIDTHAHLRLCASTRLEPARKGGEDAAQKVRFTIELFFVLFVFHIRQKTNAVTRSSHGKWWSDMFGSAREIQSNPDEWMDIFFSDILRVDSVCCYSRAKDVWYILLGRVAILIDGQVKTNTHTHKKKGFTLNFLLPCFKASSGTF